MRVKPKQIRTVGGQSFAFVSRGYTTEINKKAATAAAKGYTYRIFPAGTKSDLYVGPKRAKKSKKSIRLRR